MSRFRDNLIFIVEDDNTYSFMLDYMLSTENNFRCMSFETGEACIKHLSLKPTMIILDYNLPVMNGKETFKQIKKVDSRIPVVLLTGNNDLKTANEFIDNGAYAYLNKSHYSPMQIKSILTDYLMKIMENRIKYKESIFSEDNIIGECLIISMYFVFIISMIYLYYVKRH